MVAFRTDTVYGVSCHWGSAPGLQRLRDLKGAPHERPFVSLCSDRGLVLSLVPSDFNLRPILELVSESAWPGPLTLVLPAGAGVPDGAVGPGETWAVRVPGDPWCRDLAQRMGGVVPSTSANPPGVQPGVTASEVQELLGEYVDLVVDGGRVPAGSEASTMVDLSGSQPRLVRGSQPLPGVLSWIPGLARNTD